jgi:hypothetical protein
MPDVTVDFIGQDDITPALNKIKGEIDGLAASAQTYLKYISDPAFGKPQPGPLTQAAMDAPKRAPKELLGATNELSEGMEEVGHKTRGLVQEMATFGEQFVKWGLIWQVLEQGIKLVGDAIGQFTSESKIAEQAQNSFGLSLEESQGYLQTYYDAAHKAGMTFDEWQKFAPPAIHALESVGLSAQDAVNETSNLGKFLDRTGVDMRKLAPAVELGTASFTQLAEAGRMMGPAWTQSIAAFEKMEATERDYQRDLEHAHTLMRQSIQDTEERANAIRGIAQETGVAGSAFKAFQEAGGKPSPWGVNLEIPITAAYGLSPEMQGALGRVADQMQQQFLQGEQQIAKELGVNLRDVQLAVQAGVPGFDEKSLGAARQRAQHEKDTSDEREFQEQNYQRQTEIEQDRLYFNRQVADSLHEQNNLIQAQPDAIKAAKMAEEDLVDSIHKATTEINKQNQDLSLGFALAGQEPTYGFPSAPQAPGAPGTTPSAPTGGEQVASEGTLQQILQMLSRVLTGG